MKQSAWGLRHIPGLLGTTEPPHPPPPGGFEKRRSGVRTWALEQTDVGEMVAVRTSDSEVTSD